MLGLSAWVLSRALTLGPVYMKGGYSFAAYYPGDAYVDWVGMGTLNYGTVATWSQWWSFADIFGRYYPQLAAYKKPVIITEFGSLKVGGSRSQWLADALRDLPTTYPLVKGLVFYHNSSDNTTTMKSLDWTLRTIARPPAASCGPCEVGLSGNYRDPMQLAEFPAPVFNVNSCGN
jgi:hypothetical protein